MKKRIFQSMALLVLLTMTLMSLITFSVVSLHNYQNMQQVVRSEAEYLKTAIELEGEHYLNQLEHKAGNSRITWIDATGEIIFDNEASKEQMDNHFSRPEIQEAFQSGRGEAVRFSDTLGQQTYYVAVLMEDGSVLRVAATIGSVVQSLKKVLIIVLVFALPILALTLYLAGRDVQRIIEPINALDLENPMDNENYDELAPLLRRMAHQQEQIGRQIAEMRESQQEFAALTDNMAEGLIILNEKGNIVTVNPRAREILQLEKEKDFLDKSLLTVHRNLILQQFLNEVLSGKNGEIILNLYGLQYQVVASTIQNEGQIKGALLLILNVTEKIQQEQLRREFTANVSHELKTPLTSISGYAEIIKQGLVKEEDKDRFVEKIYQEAQRLLALIGDILELSRLDEQAKLQEYELLDLEQLLQGTIQQLQLLAEKNQVKVTLDSVPVLLEGNRQVLQEICHNLVENAIRYNRENGWVKIGVEQQEDKVVLSVADNGIGIANEEQGRIFERFYRVDKSHSRATGGTGLGLSIVKHGVQLHQGEVKLVSKLEAGTTITIILPMKQS